MNSCAQVLLLVDFHASITVGGPTVVLSELCCRLEENWVLSVDTCILTKSEIQVCSCQLQLLKYKILENL